MTDFKRIQAIDGLRGLAILLVLFCHLDIPGFGGGFVGVDVFFVISGFVITGSLYDHLGDASLVAGFYERRVRRLLPSLLVTLLGCYVAFALIFTPTEFKSLLEVGALAAIGAANFFFARTTGYFDDPALENPLLHTWSLAVEEQFYIVLALFLYGVRLLEPGEASRIKKHLLRFVALGTLVSLVLSIALIQIKPWFCYYHLPTRFWEIGVGSLLLFLTRKRSVSTRGWGSVVGLGMILYAAVFFNGTTPYPGYHALLPVVGTLLLIANCQEDRLVAGPLLGNRAMVFIGAISYALYLVHWPITVFAQRYYVRDLTVAEKAAVIALSFAVATALTYGWERSFQKGRWLPAKGALWSGATAGVALFLIIGTVSLFWQRPVEVPMEMETTLLTPEQLRLIVPSRAPRAPGFVEASQVPPLGPDAENVTAVWGDSHGLSLLANLAPEGRKQENTYQFYFCWATMPLQGVGSTPALERHNEDVLERLCHDSRIKNVILIANWTGYLEGLRYFGHRQGLEPGFSLHGRPATRVNAYAIFEEQLRKTLLQLSAAGKRVFICTPTPTYPFNVLKGVTELENRGKDPNQELSYALADYGRVNGKLLEIFDELTASIPHTGVIPVHADFFAGGRSMVVVKGKSLYSDGHHLSVEGAKQMADRIDRAIEAKP